MLRTYIFCWLCYLSLGHLLGQEPDVVQGLSKVYDLDLSFELDLSGGQALGTYYALLIGVQDYDHESIPDLEQPLEDLDKLQKMLQNYYTFDAENIMVMKNPTYRELGNQFQKLAETLQKEDNLLIFYAGHGEWDANSRAGYWLPADAQFDEKTTWYSNSILRENIRAVKAQHILLISDACFSGSLFRNLPRLAGASTAIQQLYDLPSRKAMTSGTLKTVPDHSLFIEYLIRRLGQNPSRYLPAERLFYSFKQDVIAGSPGQSPQYGDILQAGPSEGGDFIFVRR